MEERHDKFFGTFFDKSAVLNLARWAGILAWIMLGIYIFTSIVSVAQFVRQLSSGFLFEKGMLITDLLSFFTPFLLQPLPGIVYFFGLKFVENGLLLLLEIEESARRSARSVK
jgi:hypothetical protein